MLKLKPALYIILVLFVPVVLIGILIVFNDNDRSLKKIHFMRRLTPQQLKLLNIVSKPAGVTAFAASYSNFYYFKTTEQALFYKTDLHLNNPGFCRFSGFCFSKSSGLSFAFFSDNTAFFLNGNNGAITQLHLQTGKSHVFMLPVFTRAAYLSGTSFVLRSATVLNGMPDQVFIKANLTNKTIFTESALSRFSGDAGIATDGMLHFDAATNSLIYVYYYANEYICFDTALHMRYKKVTIYPDSGYHITAGGIGPSTNKLFTNTTASEVINWQSDVNKGRLYISSPFKADNEVSEVFKQSTVIDVYDIRKATYLYSFYIPFYKKQKPEAFKITGNKLLAIYQHDLILYSLSQ